MKKLLILILIIVSGTSRADEGMWLPLLIERLNYVDMQKEGLHLTAEEIYSVNHSSIKDAIIQFGGGCTGEIISDQGLILTNHHCGYGAIQSHSTVEHDYLANGFWAMSMKDELPNEGLTARFLVRIEDVTKRVLDNVNDNMTEPERAGKIAEISKVITGEAENGTGFTGRVASFFNGNEFYLFVYETFRDVRFVGAPPSSIGKYGADTDNWMWPRHTGDFSMFRVYTSPDGKPADYSINNIPLKPRHHLPVSVSGYQKGDFAMIMGYPGSTDRYMTSWGVDQTINISNPTVISIRAKKLAIMRADMDASREINIKYASKYAGIANYWKKFIGEIRGLKRLHVYEDKKAIEADFETWANATPERKAKYGNILADFDRAYKTINEYTVQRVYSNEAAIRGAEIMTLAQAFNALVTELKTENPSADKIAGMKANLLKYTERHFKNYNLPTDQKLLTTLMEMFYQNVPVSQQPSEFRALVAKEKNDFSLLSSNIFKKSLFSDRAKVEALIANPKLKTILKDPAYKLVSAFYNQALENQKNVDGLNALMEKTERLYLAGLREMEPNRKFYPDANSTMRMTYGKVLDYIPADAVHYDFTTTLGGVMEKEDPSNWEFVVPAKLKELYENKDFGDYAVNGVMPVNFLTTNDITGGNSGSPVINGHGELIGLAFDGNWEAMSGDIAFEPDLQRTISVDIRYVLFIIDKFAGAKNIIDELDLVKRDIVKSEVGTAAPATVN